MATENNSYNMKEVQKQFTKILEKFKHTNLMSAFPIIDSEHIEKLETILKLDKTDYDSEPVECCIHCKSLYLVTDNDDNDECVTCRNSLNETETHASIFHYLNKYPDRK